MYCVYCHYDSSVSEDVFIVLHHEPQKCEETNYFSEVAD